MKPASKVSLAEIDQELKNLEQDVIETQRIAVTGIRALISEIFVIIPANSSLVSQESSKKRDAIFEQKMEMFFDYATATLKKAFSAFANAKSAFEDMVSSIPM